MITAVHRIDPDNLGDMSCCALDFAGMPHEKLDINKVSSVTGDIAVIGGGGLLHGGWQEDLHTLAHRRQRPLLIAWGIGSNTHGTDVTVWPKFLDRFELVGLRDYGNPWNYVPCPSVLRFEFEQVRRLAPTHPVVSFRHHAFEWTGLPDTPVESNKGPTLLNALLFLASGETVLTNTFHGAYWALLLGRKVALHEPAISRFFSFPERLPESVDKAVAWPDYYAECLALNNEFKKRVLRLLV